MSIFKLRGRSKALAIFGFDLWGAEYHGGEAGCLIEVGHGGRST